MPVGAAVGGALGAAGSIGGALISSNAAGKASQAQTQMGYAALQQQKKMFQNALNLVQPFVSAGKTAAGTLTGLLTPGPNQTALLSQLPGFQFAQDWGQKAVANLGSTLGFGGNVLKSGAEYATGLAQQGFTNLAQLLQNLTQTGAGAAGTALGGSVQQGANIGGTLTGIGQAQASGILGQANALAGGISGTTNSVSNALLLNRLLSGGGIYGGTPV